MERLQVRFRDLPAHVLEAVCRPETLHLSRPPETITPLIFPKSKMHLWDPTPNGDPINLHLSIYRKPRILLTEKALRLAHRHARQSKKARFSCFLIGSVAVDPDEEGVTVTLDRFDPGREQTGGGAKAPTALLPGDVLVPCVLDGQQVPDGGVCSEDDYSAAFKVLHGCYSGRETLDLSKLLIVRVRLRCMENMDRLSFSLRCVGITLASSLEVVPVRALPIIPTALARNLSSSGSVAQPLYSHSASRKRGFVTMDQTRKLLLLLESDPKVHTLPLIGVWLSGVTHVYNPSVWAWCLRYLFSAALQERVMSEGETFLVVLYSLTHRDPEFYHCKPRAPRDLSFQLLSSSESLTLYKNVEPAEGRSLQFDLGTENPDQEVSLFNKSLTHFSSTSVGGASSTATQNKPVISDPDSGVEDEDLSPRPSPNPHPISQQARPVQPSVPELSMVLDGSFLNGKLADSSHPSTPPPQRRISSGSPQSLLTAPPPIRRPLTPVMSQPKVRSPPVAGHHAHKTGPGRKSTSSAGRRSSHGSSASSSSSSTSSPKHGCSPNESFHQQTQRPGQRVAHAPHPHSLRRGSVGSEQTPVPRRSQPTVFHSTPALNPTLTPCNCCPTHHVHIPPYHGNPWQGTPLHPAPAHTFPSGGSPHQECGLSPARPTDCPAYRPPCQVPGSGPISISGTHDQVAPVCQAQCCQLQRGSATVPAQPPASDLLPADAYRMLMEQDRQLKLLQAQIQKLLDAQSAVRESADEQREQGVSHPPERTNVSVAVGTGASLFWNGPDPDVPSQPADSTVEVRYGCPSTATPQCSISPPRHHDSSSDVGVSTPQSPVLGESVSMYQRLPAEADASESGDLPDHRFYQELLGQVHSRLQDDEPTVEPSPHLTPPAAPPQTSPTQNTRSREKQRGGVSGEDRVISATLKQLRDLGVNVPLDTGGSGRATVESASTLACINPAAVVPRLALSDPVGTSVWGVSGGVDLSLEANAIALKYLSDTQLSRLSLGGPSGRVGPAVDAVLFGKPADKSGVGLSILSPSNMSLATCAYMKKYGLMSGGGSGDEDEPERTREDHHGAHVDSALGRSLQLDVSEKETDSVLTCSTNKLHCIQQAPPPGDSQSQLLRDLRPKMQLLTQGEARMEKENMPKGFPQRRSSLSDGHRLPSLSEAPGSVGNFLDLSRLRQLPKLF